MTRILAIDPGPVRSGAVLLDTATRAVLRSATPDNGDLAFELNDPECALFDRVVVEMPESRGKSWVKEESWETAYWTGRLIEAASRWYPVGRIHRSAVKAHILGRANGSDADVNGALVDRYGGIGGRRAAVGVKAAPGPLYGVTGDAWAALAVAMTIADGVETLEERREREAREAA